MNEAPAFTEENEMKSNFSQSKKLRLSVLVPICLLSFLAGTAIANAIYDRTNPGYELFEAIFISPWYTTFFVVGVLTTVCLAILMLPMVFNFNIGSFTKTLCIWIVSITIAFNAGLTLFTVYRDSTYVYVEPPEGFTLEEFLEFRARGGAQ